MNGRFAGIRRFPFLLPRWRSGSCKASDHHSYMTLRRHGDISEFASESVLPDSGRIHNVSILPRDTDTPSRTCSSFPLSRLHQRHRSLLCFGLRVRRRTSEPTRDTDSELASFMRTVSRRHEVNAVAAVGSITQELLNASVHDVAFPAMSS